MIRILSVALLLFTATVADAQIRSRTRVRVCVNGVCPLPQAAVKQAAPAAPVAKPAAKAPAAPPVVAAPQRMPVANGPVTVRVSTGSKVTARTVAARAADAGRRLASALRGVRSAVENRVAFAGYRVRVRLAAW